ncbi:MAG: sigma-70 family RNA polymerase sigma factor [Salinivirgaceae bacterium]|jgi:RNA polymerase sigma-70 factor (ECF subfamily)|nr:sigma-70 family RNA polymerase sigma factor [Salinivirgaceae bacterium]MBO7432145.1 sigma-70 family RNA polymerase sigma factor [Salinivirgaceae bacterium]MBR5166600.1 sigma-70 family RNA polymerase sigma factor [Salinivirgaceae bacterium]
MNENHEFSKNAQRDFLWVERAKNGDEQAFNEILTCYKDSIYYMVLKMVKSRTDAEDLTIESFGKAFRNIEQYSPEYAFSTWLFRIASNNCIDFLRRKKVRQLNIVSTSPTETEGTIADVFAKEATMMLKYDAPNPEENIIREQKHELLRQMVANLKPQYRELVEMRYFEELSYEEIAQKLDIPIGTVKAQLFRSRELLYEMLKRRNVHM